MFFFFTFNSRLLNRKYVPSSSKELKEISLSAEKGSIADMITLGCYYHKKREWEKGTRWLSAAAERNSLEANLLMGDYYYYDVSKNAEKNKIKLARSYYEKALSAKENDIKANALFGYANCCKIMTDFSSAAESYKAAFELLEQNGIPCTDDDYNKLAECYYEMGQSNEEIRSIILSKIYDPHKGFQEFYTAEYKDVTLAAVENYMLSMQVGNGLIFDNQKNPYLRLGQLVPDLTDKHIKRIFLFLDSLIKNGNRNAVLCKGYCYFYLKKYKDAIPFLLPGAEKGDKEAMRTLGYTYMKLEEYSKALIWLEGAPNTEDDICIFSLIKCLYKTKKYEKALEWASLLDMSNYNVSFPDGDMREIVGFCEYEVGKKYLFENNYSQALSHFFKSTEFGATMAYHLIGSIYFYGREVEKNIEEACKWYRKAINAGNSFANEELGDLYFEQKKYELALNRYYKAQDIENGGSYDLDKKIDACRDEIFSYHPPKIHINIKELVKWHSQAEEKNDTKAMSQLTDYYYKLNDTRRAMVWAEILAKKGNIRALCTLGNCLIAQGEESDGVEKLRTAINENYSPAMFALAEYYRSNSNYTAAAQWYKKSIEGKNKWADKADAYYQLGRFCHYGIGMKKNIQQALIYYNYSKKSTPEVAALLYEVANDSYCENTTPKDYKNAVKYFSKALATGFLNKEQRKKAEYIIGFCYCMGGNGLNRNYEKAVQWLTEAYNDGMEKAAINIANCYFYGKYGIERDYSAAIKWLIPYAEDSRYAQYIIAECYSTGDSTVKANPNSAFFYYKRSAEGGNTNAMYKLSLCYLEGIGTSKNAKLAEMWKAKAAEKGYATDVKKKVKAAPAAPKKKKEVLVKKAPPPPDFPYHKTSDNLYMQNIEYKESKLAVSDDISEHSFDVIFKTDVINEIICYLRDIICYVHKDSPDWFARNVIEKDWDLLNTSVTKFMIINADRFHEIAEEDHFSIIRKLDISALCKIIAYRMEDENFMENEKMHEIRSCILFYRNNLFHSGDVLDCNLYLEILHKLISAINQSHPSNSSIEDINKEYHNKLKRIHDGCAERLHKK